MFENNSKSLNGVNPLKLVALELMFQKLENEIGKTYDKTFVVWITEDD